MFVIMSAGHPDYSKHGFTGNSDIYGLGIKPAPSDDIRKAHFHIGIRVGYYTQALSLWVSAHRSDVSGAVTRKSTAY